MYVVSDSQGEQRGGWRTGGWVRGDDAEAGEEHHLPAPRLFISSRFDANGG